MAQTRKPAKPAKPKPKAGADKTPPEETIRQALDELGIDRPYMGARVVGSRLELTLYGGDVVTWPPKPAPQRKRGQARKRS